MRGGGLNGPKPDVAPGLLFLVFLVASLLFYNFVGLMITLFYHHQPLIALTLVFWLAVTSLTPACFPLVFPIPTFNAIFTLIESKLIGGTRSGNNVTIATTLHPGCIKKANRRILHVIFSDLAAVCFSFVFLGLVNNLYLYQHYGSLMSPDRTSYVDVDPRTAAQLWADAGKIEFREGSRVDGSRALAYLPIGEPSTYCVAPVFYQSAEPTANVEYWAVGVDCCKSGNVFACEDSYQPDARSAYVVPNYRYMDSILFRAPAIRKHERFLEAIQIAERKFGLTSATSPLLLRWLRNPDVVDDELSASRTLTSVLQELAVIFLAVTIAGYCGLVKAQKRYEDFLDEDRGWWPGGKSKPETRGDANPPGADPSRMGSGLDATKMVEPGSAVQQGAAGRPPSTNAALFPGVAGSPGPARAGGGRAARQSQRT